MWLYSVPSGPQDTIELPDGTTRVEETMNGVRTDDCIESGVLVRERTVQIRLLDGDALNLEALRP